RRVPCAPRAPSVLRSATDEFRSSTRAPSRLLPRKSCSTRSIPPGEQGLGGDVRRIGRLRGSDRRTAWQRYRQSRYQRKKLGHASSESVHLTASSWIASSGRLLSVLGRWFSLQRATRAPPDRACSLIVDS